jgi:DNA-binding transcriptional ArsR family regulator
MSTATTKRHETCGDSFLYDDNRKMAVGMTIQVSEEIAHPRRGEIALGAVLQALSDPVRLRIVADLAASDGPLPCGSFQVPVTKSTCTYHFKVLRDAGVIHQRQEGTARLNSLRRDDLEARFPGLLDTILRHSART